MVLPEISAVLGIHQLRRLEEFISKRNEIAKRYNEAFIGSGLLRAVECPIGYRSSYYKYPIILDAKIDRAQFTKALMEEFGVETGNVFYPPCHMQGVYKKLGVNTFGSLTAAESVLSRTITLPMHVGLSESDIQYVLDCVQLCTSKFR
jgi:UDP-4-amino-4,6-dideoxy-L-N-acetyl-beta-L-altrosamine transaminase